MKNIFAEEKLPENLKYFQDTVENRKIFEEKFGKSKITADKFFTYIELNIDDNSWRTCFTFEWLYRNQPKLCDIKEILN